VIGIVASRADSASVHIAEHLLDLGEFERVDDDAHRSGEFELRFFEDLHLDLDGVASAFTDLEFLVFVSRHAGDTGPLLTAHFTGNFGAAKHGGADRELAATCPNAHSRVVAALAEYAPDGYDVGTECTHHGPTGVGAPSMFVELGSDEAEWEDPGGARAVAKAVLDLEGVESGTERTLAAFGGGHYAPRSTRIVRETDWAVGHVAADWCLEDLGDPDEHRDVLEQAFAKSGATRAVIDGEKQDLEAAIADLGYDVVSETWVREVSDVPLSLAESLGEDLRSVDDGLRFGAPATVAPDDADYVLVDLPAKLVDAALAIDERATVDAALTTALAAETAENGNRLGARAAFFDADAYETFVTRLTAVLDDDYDVTREGDRITARRAAFDPQAAADRGVPEGPAFGRLANGEPVEVDGETVHPADVSRTETITVSVGFRERPRERVRRPSDAEGKGN
jgi:D-aminoacyl-tRNA deacylase